MERTPRGGSDSDVRIELFLRSLSPPAMHTQHESLIARLERLESGGIIDGFGVEVWGRQLALSSAAARTEAGRRILEYFEEFTRWATRNSRSVAPFFEVRSVESRMAEERYTALLFPVAVLAEFEGEELVHVAPCSDDESLRTVDDRIAAFERRLPPSTRPDDSDAIPHEQR